jgi:zinc transport system permease protein
MADVSLLDLLGYTFFQNALIGGTIAALACALIGLFLILRNEAMIGDGIAHTAFGGIALGLFVGVFPLAMALVVAVASVLGISYMRRKGLARSDSAIAVMLALGFSLGLIIISLADGFNIELFSFLFGSILTIDAQDLALISTLGLVTVGFVGVFYKELLSITFDEQAARLVGIPVGAMGVAFNVLVAVAIVLSIKVVGMILVVALLVLPGLTALQLDLSFKGTAAAAIVLAVASVLVGITVSALTDVATSGVIIFAAAAIFLFVAAYKRLG